MTVGQALITVVVIIGFFATLAGLVVVAAQILNDWMQR